MTKLEEQKIINQFTLVDCIEEGTFYECELCQTTNFTCYVTEDTTFVCEKCAIETLRGGTN